MHYNFLEGWYVMKKIMTLHLLLVLLVAGCSNSDYDRVTSDGYKRSKGDNSYLVKRQGDKSYYKYDVENPGIYLIIERDRKTDERKLLLSAEYRGEDWIYMEKAIFKSDGKEADVDFFRSRFSDGNIEEKVLPLGAVEEKVVFTLSEEDIEEIKTVFESEGDIELVLQGRYENRKTDRILTSQEKDGFLKIIKIFKK